MVDVNQRRHGVHITIDHVTDDLMEEYFYSYCDEFISRNNEDEIILQVDLNGDINFDVLEGERIEYMLDGPLDKDEFTSFEDIRRIDEMLGGVATIYVDEVLIEEE